MVKLSSSSGSSRTRMGRYVPAPSVVRLTPAVRGKACGRDWVAVDARGVAKGMVLSLVTCDMFTRVRTGLRGQPALKPELMLLLVLDGASTGASYRQIEGRARTHAAAMGVDERLAPDHTSLSRFITHAEYDGLVSALGRLSRTQRRTGLVHLAVDSTGMGLTKSGGWAADKPGVDDKRKGRYRRAHLATDVESRFVVSWCLTKAYGPGSGDPSVGPGLIDAAGSGRVVASVCADGAYDAQPMFDAAARAGAPLLVPLPARARYTGRGDRDRLLTQQSRLGRKEWKRRSGYHQRSQVESVNAVLDRIGGGNRLRTRSLAAQVNEFAVKVGLYNMVVAAGM